ncbi:MAG: hypothetical protein ABL919_07905 [Methylococcales bacterium]|nr:hypothetical protein [Methylococcaceae bacterium]
MNKTIFSILVLVAVLTVPVQAAVTCNAGDLQGQWEIKYYVTRPQQVGVCTVVFDNNLVPSGSCENLTYDLQSDIFDGEAQISKSCNASGKLLLNDGQKISFTGKMKADKQTLSGNIASRLNGYLIKGTANLRKTAELSCQVTPLN